MKLHIKRSTGYIAEAQAVLYTYICHICDNSAVKSVKTACFFSNNLSVHSMEKAITLLPSNTFAFFSLWHMDNPSTSNKADKNETCNIVNSVK